VEALGSQGCKWCSEHILLLLDCMWVLIGVGNAQKRGDTDHHTENVIARKMF